MNLGTWIPRVWHLAQARLALLAGRTDRARSALKRMLRVEPGHFGAHFLLGRLYWREQSEVKARREFDVAWQIDPRRFERLYARLRATREGAPDLLRALEGTDEGVRVIARSVGPGARRSVRERHRLGSLPPISADEVLDIDWDRLEEDLRRDQGRR